jgi:hypothetical protein
LRSGGFLPPHLIRSINFQIYTRRCQVLCMKNKKKRSDILVLSCKTKKPMPLRTIHISQADADTARYEMYSHVDLIVQKRMHCLWLKSLGFKNQEIQRVLHCSRNTIGTYLGLYESGGLQLKLRFERLHHGVSKKHVNESRK